MTIKTRRGVYNIEFRYDLAEYNGKEIIVSVHGVTIAGIPVDKDEVETVLNILYNNIL